MCLTCQTLWLLFLFHYERVSKPCMTNAHSGYNDLFSWFSESWSPFYQNGLYLEQFIEDVIILVLLPFCMNKFADFGFQVSIWNPELVRGQIPRPIWPPFPLTSLGIQHIRISLQFDIESNPRLYFSYAGIIEQEKFYWTHQNLSHLSILFLFPYYTFIGIWLQVTLTTLLT